MKKVIGYIISLFGIVLVAAPLIPQVYEKLPIPEGMSDLYITIAGVVLVILGLAFLMNRGGNTRTRGKSRGGVELPIYEGKNLVGYRRH